MRCVCFLLILIFWFSGGNIVRMCIRTNRHGNDTIPRIADGHDCQTVEEKPRLHVSFYAFVVSEGNMVSPVF